VAQFLRSNLTTIFGSKPRVSDLVDRKSTLVAVIPAEAGIQAVLSSNSNRTWMPAFAGMTNFHFA
jgi:hypothetical protein